eukprot:974228-Rhodomonas_salina.1
MKPDSVRVPRVCGYPGTRVDSTRVGIPTYFKLSLYRIPGNPGTRVPGYPRVPGYATHHWQRLGTRVPGVDLACFGARSLSVSHKGLFTLNHSQCTRRKGVSSHRPGPWTRHASFPGMRSRPGVRVPGYPGTRVPRVPGYLSTVTANLTPLSSRRKTPGGTGSVRR